jgi:hypothetical protein
MIRISEDSFDDLNQGFLFYETQSPGLGEYFLGCLRADIDYHRCLSRIFPYGIFYTSDDREVAVWAVVDLRRDPEWIAARLAAQRRG